jgi:hypothetical protein
VRKCLHLGRLGGNLTGLILVGTSIWIDHLLYGDANQTGLLEGGRVLGELATGSIRQRAIIASGASGGRGAGPGRGGFP